MILFQGNNHQEPLQKFKNFYDRAVSLSQRNIQVASISSFCKELNEVDSRYVNIKFIDNKSFIFFSNYNSNKAKQFLTHDQVSILFFWDKINVQIRLKGHIKKLSPKKNEKYFLNRNIYKNALAISSNQSKVVKSYSEVIEKYNKTLAEADLKKCPQYWGGYIFTPYQYEFWEGHENRLNKRELFSLYGDNWTTSFLEP